MSQSNLDVDTETERRFSIYRDLHAETISPYLLEQAEIQVQKARETFEEVLALYRIDEEEYESAMLAAVRNLSIRVGNKKRLLTASAQGGWQDADQHE